MHRPSLETIAIKELFNNQKLRIPQYQREYVWSTSEAEVFLNDIFYFIEEELKNKEYFEELIHFLGVIYLTKSPLANETITYDIVDGQQRITSYFLLLVAIKRFIFNNLIKGKQLIKGSKNNFQRAIDLVDKLLYLNVQHEIKEAIYSWTKPVNIYKDIKLQVLEKHQETFSKSVVEKSRSRNYNFARTIDYFTIKLKDKFENECQWDFQHFEKKYLEPILKNISVIKVVLNSIDDAYSTFERLNDRGVKLTVFEILNIKLITKIKNNNFNQKKYIKLKEAIQTLCEKNKLKPSYVLWQHYLIKYGFLKEKEVPKKYAKKLENFDAIEKEFMEIEKILINYHKLFMIDTPIEDRIGQNFLNAYRFLESKYFKYAISYLYYKNNNLDEHINFIQKAIALTWNLSINKTSLGSEISSELKNMASSSLRKERIVTKKYDDFVTKETLENKLISKDKYILLPLLIESIINGKINFLEAKRIKINVLSDENRIKNINNLQNLPKYFSTILLKEKFKNNFVEILELLAINKKIFN